MRRSRKGNIQITDLWRGENEQPPWKRIGGSVEDSKNIRFDPLRGAVKREGSDLLVDIDTDTTMGGLDPTKDYYWDKIGQYVFAIGHGIIRVFDENGISLPIDVDETTEGGIPFTSVVSGNTWSYLFDYLNESNPKTAFDTAVAVDTIIITNRNMTVASQYTRSFQESLDLIIEGIRSDDDPSAPAATAVFRNAVDDYDELIALSDPVGFKTTSIVDSSPSPPFEWSKGDVLEVLKNNGNSYSPARFAVFDSWEQSDVHNKWIMLLIDWYDANGNTKRINGGDELKHDTNSPQEIVKLADPHEAGKKSERAQQGDVRRTKLDFGNNPAGYYVFYKGNDVVGQWYRIPASQFGDKQSSADTGVTGQDERSSEDGRITANTAPIRVLIDDTGSETRMSIGLIPYDERLSGDKETNEKPSFVDNKIKSVEFFQSRLAFVTSESIVLSRTNDFFNFWFDNQNNIVDDDRIDLDMNSRNLGAAMRSAVVGSGLLIRSENGQAAFHSGDQALTSTNGRFRQVGDFRDLDIPADSNGVLINIVDRSNRVHQFRATGGDVDQIFYAGQLNDHRPLVFDGISVRSINIVEKSTFFITENGS